ncbi:PAS domain S-box-containing protein [Constrictibacter sp. MBR-5]|uniref:PAS domain-containing hybrid sensor histidine kinase/response regulator n=1 Tax=Constrictibacter sp. MBR-5 TaxID=3156467 RepID=UPI0033992C8F
MRGPTNLSCSAIDAFEALSFPVWLFSSETLQILASNQAAQTWLGYDGDTLRSMTIADLRAEADRTRIVDQVRHFDGTVTDAGTWTVVAKSGDRYTAAFNWHKVVFDGTDAVVASVRDMTQVARAEAKAESLKYQVELLRREVTVSQEHLSSLFDAMPGKILVVTPDEYKIVAVTDDYAQAVMVERNALLGRPLFEVFPDDPNEPEADGVTNLRASLQRVAALRVTDVMNIQRYPVRGSDGVFQERFWLPRNKPVFDRAGNLIYLIHRVEDVTELLAEAGSVTNGTVEGGGAEPDGVLQAAELRGALLTLRERETRLGTVARLLDLGSWEYDLERGSLSWSNRIFDMYGVPPHRGAPSFDGYVAMVHPDDQPEMLSTHQHFIDTGAPEIEFQHRIIRADGSVAHIRGVGARHRVEGREIVIGVAQDITRFREAEERLREAARRQEIAGYMARLGSWRVDLNPTRLTWSPETAAIHEEPEGTSPSLEQAINYYAPEHRARIGTVFQACVQTGQPFDEVLQIVTAKGNRVWVRAIGEAVRDDQGGIVAVEGAFQDISELIAARSESEDLSRRLRETLENIGDAFFLLDDEWRFSFLNGQGEKLLRRRREDLLGKVVWEEFPEAVGSTFQREYERAVVSGRSVRFREFFPPLATWFEVHADPTPEGLAIYFRDVTQEQARQEQLRLLEAAVSRQGDILLITEAGSIDGPDGPRIVYVNDAYERRTGYSRDEVIGKSPRILQGPKTDRTELDRIRQALETWSPVRSELINYTKSGEEFWIELDIVPLADETGRYTHWVSVERDVTDRKRAEEEIRVNQERFRLVAKATNDVVWDWDLTAGTIWWNEGLQSLFGYDLAEIVHGIESWMKHIHPDDKDRILESVDAAIAGTATTWAEEYRFLHADGHPVTVMDRGFVIRNAEGKAVRMLGSMIDVSGQRDMESRLRQAQKLEAVGQLTGGVAHDFNNLLTVILGNAEILSDELSEQQQLRVLADMTATAAERAAELTSRLLAFSRKQALQPRVLDVSTLIHGLEGLLRRSLPENIDIQIVRAGGLWQAEIDPSQLESAVLNLVLNARDAMPDGGHLTIEMANAALDDDYVGSEQDLASGQYVMIAVTDTGHGIPPAVLGRVFEPFFTTKEVGKGSGLGLSMVYGFVKQSGGHIRIYSEPDEGTVVKLYFPRACSKDDQVRLDNACRMIIGGTETILVVEDDQLVRGHLSARLVGLGYQVVAAETGPRALEILKQMPGLDLLLTDIVLPGGMNGRELADTARAMRPELKVLFTSGYSENAIIHHGRLDPGVELLGKPYRREQLAAKVRKVLDEV